MQDAHWLQEPSFDIWTAAFSLKQEYDQFTSPTPLPKNENCPERFLMDFFSALKTGHN